MPKHRGMQKQPSGLDVPILDRTCQYCKDVFRSKQGLKNHQSRRNNPGCYRTGVHERRTDWVKKKTLRKNSVKKTRIPIQRQLDSLFEKHKSGTPFTKEVKKTCINAYQRFIDDGCGTSKAIGNVQFWFFSLLHTTSGIRESLFTFKLH